MIIKKEVLPEGMKDVMRTQGIKNKMKDEMEEEDALSTFHFVPNFRYSITVLQSCIFVFRFSIS